MSEENEMTIVHLKGIFQYFLVFDQSHEIKLSHKMSTVKPEHGVNTVKIYEKYEKLTENIRKRVHFSPNNAIHQMYVWNFAHKQARMDIWQQIARDHARFEKRINVLSEIISPILIEKSKKFHQQNTAHP